MSNFWATSPRLVPKRLRIEKDIISRVKRVLKGKGKLNIASGQEVTPADIIGTSQVSSGFRTINLADALSVSCDAVGKYLKKQIGQRIYKDELLAFKEGGLFRGKKFVVSPTDGVLDYINPETGEIRMTFLPKKVDLPAGVFGIVETVDNERGVVIIKTQVSRIYGMLGSGRIRDGTLLILGGRDKLIGKEDISPKYDGHILVGGSLIFKDAITSAVSSGINGIITGGINAKDYRSMAGGRISFPKKLENDIGISIVVCEGFGSLQIGEDIYQLLLEYNGKFVSMEGNSAVLNLPSFESKSIIRVKSIHLPPIQDVGSSPKEDSEIEAKEQMVSVQELKAGSQVRVVGNTYAAEQGRVLSIDKTESVLPSGLKAILVMIETKRRKIKLPVANLELIS